MKKVFSFENFYVYDGNRVAYLAAQKIVQFPGEIFNPLYVYSGTGLGKTHLLWALYTELNKKYPATFFTGKDFERYLDEARDHSSLLVVDDIYTIADKYQPIFLEVIDSYLTAGKQICFSGTIAPRDLNNFNHKLVSRLEGGLVCDIQPPKEMALVDIIKKKSTEMSIILPDEIALELAQLSAGSFRAIEGMVNRLVAYSSLGNLNVDLNSIRMILKDFYPKGLYSPVSSLLEELKKNATEVLQEVTEKIDMREEYRERIYIWEMKGFDTSLLKPLLDGDVTALASAYNDFIKKVERLIELQKIFGTVDTNENPDDAMRIESMLFSPGKISEIETLIEKMKRGAPIPPPVTATAPIVAVPGKVVVPPPAAPAIAEAAKPLRTFDTYIIGKSNKAVRDFYYDSIVTNPGTKFNPFIIIGGEGNGKTHLLEAICSDLLSRRIAAVLVDLEQAPSIMDSGLSNTEVLIIDNLTALWDFKPIMRRDWLDLLNDRIKGDKEIIMSSELATNDDRFTDEERMLFELGMEVVVNPPGLDIAEVYIRKSLPGTWAEQVIKTGLPDFERFSSLVDFVKSLSPEKPAPDLEPVGPAESVTTKGEAGSQPTEEVAAAVSEPSVSEPSADSLVNLGLPGEEPVPAAAELPEPGGIAGMVHDMVTEVSTAAAATPPAVVPAKPIVAEIQPDAASVQLKTVKEERLIIPEIPGELIEENY
ncbi:MAG TPA: DnaA/Hda family protein [bacterium]